MRILVTGGAGFIGSHVVDAYVGAGHEVVVLDSLWSHGGGRREHIPENVSFVHMDIRDDGIGRIFAEFKPEIVSHHAAQHSVAIGSRDPKYDADVNVVGMLNVLEAAVKAETRKVIFASSAATYGDAAPMPVDESSPQLPVSPYGISKMVTEHYLRFYNVQHGLDFTALRYGNVYGPRQDPNGEAGVISIFIGRFLAKAGVKIFWDGEQTRDYVYVSDIAELNVKALDAGSAMCYCIGTNRRTSVNEIYRALVEVTGFEAPVEYLPRDLWVLGLGHLGNAYLWSLATLPYPDPKEAEFALFDFDKVEKDNIETGVIFTTVSIDRFKTRECDAWLDRRGFRTRLVERRFDATFRRQYRNPDDKEPALALSGFDSNSPRRDLPSAGFRRVIECGLGGMAENFDTIGLHTLPNPRAPDELWPDLSQEDEAKLAAHQERMARENPGYGDLAADDCGRRALAGKSVAVPFVGSAAASFAVAEVIRLLHEGPAYHDIKLGLADPGKVSAHRNGNYTARDAVGATFVEARKTKRRADDQ